MQENIERLMPGLAKVLAEIPEDLHDFVRVLAGVVREIGMGPLQENLAEWDGDPERNPLHRYGAGDRPDGGAAGGSRRSPLHERMNVIPSPRGMPAFCCRTVLAVAHGSKPPGGLAMVLRLLREHLIHCGSGPKALHRRTAILMTDTWIDRTAYESSRDLQAHVHAAGLRLFILHWDGRSWRRMHA